MKKATFTIIEFESERSNGSSYFPKYFEDSGLWSDLIQLDGFKNLVSKNLPMGKSRYGGAVVDWPKGVAYPTNKQLLFMAQLNLKEFKKFDRDNLLPKQGHLYFFVHNEDFDDGEAFYFDVQNDELERNYLEGDNQFFGTLEILDNIRSETEKWKNNYIKLDKDELKCTVCGTKIFLDCTCDNIGMLPYERDEIIDRKYVWDFDALTYKSKLFGIYTDVQCNEQEIENMTFSDYVVLFQVGENINNEGVFSVLINKNDLKDKNFSHCRFRWSQT